MDKIALLIQGPMISRGRTGADPFDPTIVEVNTAADVQATIDEARSVGFDPIVLSTWADDPAIDDVSRLRGLDRIAALPEPPTRAAYDYQKYKDNRGRQAFGCLEGLRVVRAAAEPSFAARMRTDQTLDLRELFAATRQSAPGELRVLAMRRGRNAQMQDFVIAGTTADVVGHYEALAACNYFPFHNDMHYDLFFKDAYGQLKGQIEPAAFVLRTYFTLDVQIPLFHRMFGDRIRPLPAKVARSLVWRGRPFSEEYMRTQLVTQEEWQAEGKAAALRAIPRRGVKLNRWNRPYFIDVQRLFDLGLAPYGAPAPWRRQLSRALGAIRVRVGPAVKWS